MLFTSRYRFPLNYVLICLIYMFYSRYSVIVQDNCLGFNISTLLKSASIVDSFITKSRARWLEKDFRVEYTNIKLTEWVLHAGSESFISLLKIR